MLKVESYPTSGHTSGDDVEVITNNSSDIEVISSPVLSEKSFQAANNQRLIQTKVMNYSPSKDSFRRKAKGANCIKDDLTINFNCIKNIMYNLKLLPKCITFKF